MMPWSGFQSFLHHLPFTRCFTTKVSCWYSFWCSHMRIIYRLLTIWLSITSLCIWKQACCDTWIGFFWTDLDTQILSNLYCQVSTHVSCSASVRAFLIHPSASDWRLGKNITLTTQCDPYESMIPSQNLLATSALNERYENMGLPKSIGATSLPQVFACQAWLLCLIYVARGKVVNKPCATRI